MTLAEVGWMRCALIAVPMLAFVACSGDKSGSKTVETANNRVHLLIPGSDKASLKAPDVFRARFETTKGSFVIEVHRDWAPLGADRFYYLVKNGFYDDIRFFRAIDGFMVQFGMSGDPKLSSVWRTQYIYDDSVKQSNKRGFITYAKGGANTRTTQVFINYGDNSRSLDSQGFAPFGQVVDGMDVVDKLYKGYGDAAPRGQGPNQTTIHNQGNAYLDKDFPQLDKTVKATIVDEKKK
jgi:peptidyl-prolyl cis-trans isomerase A (cyclophilin A)